MQRLKGTEGNVRISVDCAQIVYVEGVVEEDVCVIKRENALLIENVSCAGADKKLTRALGVGKHQAPTSPGISEQG